MGISPDVGVGGLREEFVIVDDLVSRLEEDVDAVFGRGTVESREPSRLSAFGAGGAR